MPCTGPWGEKRNNSMQKNQCQPPQKSDRFRSKVGHNESKWSLQLLFGAVFNLLFSEPKLQPVVIVPFLIAFKTRSFSRKKKTPRACHMQLTQHTGKSKNLKTSKICLVIFCKDHILFFLFSPEAPARFFFPFVKRENGWGKRPGLENCEGRPSL